MKKRSEGYFGLHFDFHAGADSKDIGKTLTEGMIREVIEMLRPDYIQCDCKGHPGYSSYPTNVGNPAPGQLTDILEIWRKVTKEYDVPLVVHYSGGWDARAVELHPEWATINEDGSRHKDIASPFKGYVDGLLIPQLVEVANEYGVDGAWIDGEAWAAMPDFDEEVIAAFEKKTGMKLVRLEGERPREPGEINPWGHDADKGASPADGKGVYDKRSKEYRAFLDFCRERFLAYVKHYVDEVHRRTKNFEITSNWIFTSEVPRPVTIDVDYLSGDYSACYNFARLDGRIFCEQGKPWDMMPWGFTADFSLNACLVTKSPDALCREVSAFLPLGGGLLMFYTQRRDGSVRLWEMHELKPVVKFTRDREPFLKGCTPFSSICTLYSDYDLGNTLDTLFYLPGTETARNAVNLVLDSAHTCGCLMDHTVTPEYLKDKTVVILPDMKFVRADIKGALLKFVEEGGNIILTGYECCKAFEDVLGVTLPEESQEHRIYIKGNPRWISQCAKIGVPIAIEDSVSVVRTFCDGDYRMPAEVSPNAIITKTNYGKGAIVAIYYNLFEVYSISPDFYVRNMVGEIIDGLDTEPLVKYEKGLKFVDIVTARKDGKLLVSLTNTVGIYSEKRLRAYDEIPPLTDLEMSVKVGQKPKSVTLQPENVVPKYTYDSATQRVTVAIDRLHIHTIVVIEIM